jgi:hypothetical protein
VKVWLSAAAVTVISWLMKASAPLLIGERRLPPTVIRVTALIAPVLIAGLIVTELGANGVDWTQLSGVGAAGVLRLVKVPMLLAVAGGIALTALLRLTA